MPVLDRSGPVNDRWVTLADDAVVPAGASVVASLTRLKSDHNALFASAAAVGVEVSGDVALDELEPFLPRLTLVVARFTTMRDGRPFSLGRLLRERYGFKGELRAAGPFIPDQVLFLLRCGFTTFEVGDDFSLESLKRSVAAYTAWYQRATDRAPTVLDLRHKSDRGPEDSKPNGGKA